MGRPTSEQTLNGRAGSDCAWEEWGEIDGNCLPRETVERPS